MGRTTPDASPTPASSSNPEGDSNSSTQITTLQKTDPSIETKLEDSVEKTDTGSVKRSPPPPPQRNHRLSNAANPQTATAQGPSAGDLSLSHTHTPTNTHTNNFFSIAYVLHCEPGFIISAISTKSL